MAVGKGTAETADGYSRFDNDISNANDYGSNIITSAPIANTSSLSDIPHEIDKRSNLRRNPEAGDQQVYSSNQEQNWEMNYHEAAIFLEEGENNEKFDSHPRHPDALPAYLLVHNNWYYGLDLATSILLLVLAFGEEPAVPLFELPVGIHGTIELLALGIIGIELALKLRWIGWTTILKHKRTMIKCITLAIMVVEAIVVLVRQTSHLRVTRALRPIFLVDTKACGGVRRFIRQILQSLPPILDMFGLLLFFISIYTLLGYYLFSGDDGNPNFVTLSDSFVSMFVLLTTANFPDVMMPSYAKSKWNVLFFISYIGTVLYVLMNLVLAVVFETFTRIERDKFRKLLLHKRKACQQAFKMLVSKQNPQHMHFKQFEGLMRYYSPRIGTLDIILMFKYMNKSGSGVLSMEEFLKIYDAVTLRWISRDPSQLWFESIDSPMKSVCKVAHTIVTWPHFEKVIYSIIVANGVAMLIRLLESAPTLQQSAYNFCAEWDTALFLALFCIEALIRILGLGFQRYLESGWNVYDITVTIAAIIGLVMIRAAPNFIIAVILRPLRLLRLYKLKKRYRDVFGTLVLLSPLMCSVALVMLVVYYFFAIIGMELFSQYPMKNCCVNSTVEDFYKFSENGTTALGFYYLNNFKNIVSSGVTLFELAVVNNWFIIMNAYAFVVGPWSRSYFMMFYLCMLVVLTIVVASVLEAFRFRIQYKRQTSKREEERMLHEEVELRWEELQTIVQDFSLLERIRGIIVVGSVTTFIGRRPRTRDVLQQRMYMTEITEWMEDAEREEHKSSEPIPLDPLQTPLGGSDVGEELIHSSIIG